MNGGCSVPISAFAKIEGDKLVFKVSISTMDSKNIIKVEDSFDCNDLNTGEKMYKKILKNGGKKILQELKKENEKN
jgi:hydroxymethylbilane synthase